MMYHFKDVTCRPPARIDLLWFGSDSVSVLRRRAVHVSIVLTRISFVHPEFTIETSAVTF